jgi:cation diffusion facilitator CzcD-associated flavoprotein CzcO
VRFKHRVTRAAWSSERAVWTLDIEREGHEPIRIEARFLWMCTGYYRYDAGYTPEFEGREQFGGTILHPQRWPDDLDYAGKRVVVIGSGATAVTLVPAMAEKAAHVTMLQRSPTYVLSRPAVDRMAERLQALLPEQLAHDLSRWKNVALGTTLYQLSKRRPEAMKRWLLGEVRKAVGPSVDVERHFSPKYGPWDERLCLVPDNDLFKVLRDGRASIVTDTVARFDATGIVLGSGERLDADVVVTATGLELLFLGGTELVVDGRTIEPHDHLTFKGMMFSDIPNLAFTAGYTNASWTLKADLIAEHVIRLLHTMRARGATTVTPRKPSDVEPAPFLDLRSGYILRAEKRFPTQGSKRPWKLYQNYLLDLLSLRHGRVDDPNLEFSQDR